MQATALVCDARQQFSLAAVTLPAPGPGEILVRALYSGVSIGTEFALIRNKVSWGPYPLCTGYMAIGVVEGVGPDTDGYRPGDKVYYRAGHHIALADGTAVSGVSGTHCSHAITPVSGTHAAAPLPKDAPEAEASMFVLPAVGLEGVNMAGPRLGEHVLVYGAGLIGLGVIAAAAARGCVVTAADLDADARARALAFGADYALDPARDDLAAHFRTVNPGPDAADVTFEATGLPDCLLPAIELTKMRGAFVWQGNYGAAPFDFHFLPAHNRRLTMSFPCDDGGPACRLAVLKQMARGTLPWARAITHRIDAADAPAVYKAINQGERGYAGVVIRWS